MARASRIAVRLHRVTVFWWHNESFYFDNNVCGAGACHLSSSSLAVDPNKHNWLLGPFCLCWQCSFVAFWCPKSVFGSESWLRAFSWKRKYWRIIQSPLTKHCYCQLQNLFVQISFSCFVPSKAILLFGGCPVDRRVMSLPQIIRKTV